MTPNLESLFGPLETGAILHEDSDLIVVDKPAGMSMDASERGGDALVPRLKALLSERGGNEPSSDYLSVHEHLDRDASGAVVLGRRPQVNAKMAEMCKSGAWRTTWLAAVQGPIASSRGQLDVRLVRERGATVRPATRRDRNVIEVHASWRKLDSHTDRSLLELEVDRGGARYVRAAIGSMVGVHVGGDGSAPAAIAPRLMLHAVELQFVHPSTGKPIRVRSPLPAEFGLWLEQGQAIQFVRATSPQLLDRLLRQAAAKRHLVWACGDVDAFRLFHGEGEGLPGLDVDRYGDHLVVWIGEQFEHDAREQIIDAVWRLGPAGVYVKVRPKQASRIVDSRRPEVAAPHALRGDDAPEAMVVRERELKFEVRLGDGLSTGLFLDQRDNRGWLAANSAGRSVLNLFSYTCSFTVAAARAGARSTVSVDSSPRVLAVGERNLEINGVSGDHHSLVCADVLNWLPMARRRGAQFDRIVLDPPSFSTTHKSRFSFAEDIIGVAADCLGLLSEQGGLMLVCTNHRSVRAGQLARWLEKAAQQAARRIGGITPLAGQPDFPSMVGAEPHLKALAVEIEGR